MKIQPNTTISTKFNFKNTYDELGVGKLYLVWKKNTGKTNIFTNHTKLLHSAHNTAAVRTLASS